jgi:hypothetical protein
MGEGSYGIKGCSYCCSTWCWCSPGSSSGFPLFILLFLRFIFKYYWNLLMEDYAAIVVFFLHLAFLIMKICYIIIYFLFVHGTLEIPFMDQKWCKMIGTCISYPWYWACLDWYIWANYWPKYLWLARLFGRVMETAYDISISCFFSSFS